MNRRAAACSIRSLSSASPIVRPLHDKVTPHPGIRENIAIGALLGVETYIVLDVSNVKNEHSKSKQMEDLATARNGNLYRILRFQLPGVSPQSNSVQD